MYHQRGLRIGRFFVARKMIEQMQLTVLMLQIEFLLVGSMQE
jgi:hypothetical protein